MYSSSWQVHGWRYTAWQPWNGTTLRAVAWPAHKPANGTAVVNATTDSTHLTVLKYYEELFEYREAVGSELDLDALDVAEVSGLPENAPVIARLYAQTRAYALESIVEEQTFWEVKTRSQVCVWASVGLWACL